MSIGGVLGGAANYLRAAMGLGDQPGGLSGDDFSSYVKDNLPAYGSSVGVPSYGSRPSGDLPSYGSHMDVPSFGSSAVPDFGFSSRAAEGQNAAYNTRHPEVYEGLKSPPGQNTGPGSYPNPGPAPSAQGGGWTGVATASENKGITAQQIDQVIAKTRANSPMIGKGQLILDYANARNVSVPEIMGIFLAESELGTTAGPGWNIAGVGGPGNFHGYASLDDAIRGAIDNLGSDLYAGKSLEEHIGYWFAGPQKWAQFGLDASDGQNGTVRDYISGKVAPMYQAFGVPLQQAQAPAPAPAGGGGNYSGSARGVASLYGGTTPALTQDFNEHDPSLAGVYDFGTQFGMDGDGHTGWDIGTPVGTSFYMPQGLNGTVTIAGGSGYYKDETGTRDPATSGELRITLDNGMELILGHNSSINVRQGQRVTAGMFLGQTGWANGAHQHVEVRVKDPSTPSGWRIVSPAVLFGTGAGAGEGP